MGRFLCAVTLIVFGSVHFVYSQNTLSGKVLNEKTKDPVEFAVVATPDNSIWSVTNKDGFFSVTLPNGNNVLVISCLGFAKTTVNIEIKTKIASGIIYYIKEDNLALDEVVVVAQKRTEEVATSYSIDHNALTHAQMKGVSDILSQLPGGQTSNATNLSEKQQIALRSDANNEIDNPTFGTAIEVDGVRLSNNAAFGSYSENGNGIEGIDTRNIAVNNIESIEVVTGLPSVEHGDLTSGIVKIHTRKGKSSFEIEAVTKPEIKSISINKGFDLGKNRGLLNTSLEHTRSISDRVSPYTTYTRDNLTLTYRNTFGKEGHPIELVYGFTGNLGGYDSEADPDLFVNTYEKKSDNVLRSNLNINWLLNRKWITGIDFTASVNYSNRQKKIMTNKSSSSSVPSNHSLDEGYFIGEKYADNPNAPIIMIPPGYWYQLQYDDNKPITYSASIKADWVRKFGEISNKLKAGGEFVYSGNLGRGIYYDDIQYAPSWREYRYDEQPYVKSFSFYLEDKVTFNVFEKELQVQAGIRSDITSIKGSEYGVADAFSPRINAQYELIEKGKGFLKSASIHSGWGDAVKLPSVNVLYPVPSYSDKLAFSSTTSADGTAFYAYHTTPMKLDYNANLMWQRNRKVELGTDVKLGKTKISVTVYRDKTFSPYRQGGTYQPFSYKLTQQTDLEKCEIPANNRSFSIDQTTGIVTVSDVTSQQASQQLTYTTKNTYKKTDFYENGSPVLRKGMEWIVDFGKISAIKTSIRVDGNYYSYRGLNETITEKGFTASNMADGNPYKYVGYFVGSETSTNGSEAKRLKTNVTFTTHIPAIRTIISFRIESCFYDYQQDLSEYAGGTRSYVLDNKDSFLPAASNGNIYEGNHYSITYPLYYSSLDNINERIPFLEALLNAKNNDPALFNELVKLAVRTTNDFYFREQNYSAYFSGNFNLTKEIGEKISVSFLATNFFNNMGQIKDSQSGNKKTLYKTGYVPFPKFYYGLSMRLKI